MTTTNATEPSWSDLIGGMGTWKTGNVRAVHKPLLVLIALARAQRRESNIIPYRDIDPTLTKALRDFGPPRRSYHPEYPFWYLQSDGFWSVHAAVNLPKPGQAEPTRAALLKAHAVAVVPESRWSELQQQAMLIPDLARQLLHTFWPDSIHDTIADELGLDLDVSTSVAANRQRDPRFRSAVLRAYERRCAVCGFQASIGGALLGIEAAHIHFKVDGGPDVVTNGLALCSLHHKAFDLGAIGISHDLRVVVSQDVDGNAPGRRALVDFSGRRLEDAQTSSDRPGAKFLRWHQRYVFRGPPRPYA